MKLFENVDVSYIYRYIDIYRCCYIPKLYYIGINVNIKGLKTTEFKSRRGERTLKLIMLNKYEWVYII